jgi:hypothetical protein
MLVAVCVVIATICYAASTIGALMKMWKDHRNAQKLVNTLLPVFLGLVAHAQTPGYVVPQGGPSNADTLQPNPIETEDSDDE